jgi:Domain of Unknown Function (DUF1080)
MIPPHRWILLRASPKARARGDDRMKKLARITLGAAVGVVACFALFAQGNNPFLGRWDFNIPTASGGNSAAWLGIYDDHGPTEVWYQPTGGNVYQIQDFKISGSHISITITAANAQHPATTWELDADGDKLNGSRVTGDQKTALTGARAPKLDRAAPKAWSKPEPLFNGKDLTGWEPIGDVAHNNWSVKDGVLENSAHGANLRSTRTFTDFKVHYEVNCPDQGNSGFYLRGRYEMQIDYESDPPERSMASVYGRIMPLPTPPRTPGQWETFDVTLIGRMVSEMHNGVQVISNREIEGITGGALDANEGEPGPFYIQGDHTGGLQFRNITVSVPK